ncbi:MAG TPA: glycerol-3-phosphate dehydrogenase [Candidatus Methylomirabilis sp.]|nr:glycerol-3-phosphate dehydrogenase [Candidatus Methylomirabilis sp.]
MATVTIVGAGLMGTATAYPLAENGHSIRLVGTHLDSEIIQSCKQRHYHPRLKRELPPGVRAYFLEEIAEAFVGTDIVVSGVNSLGIHWIGETIGPLLRPGQMIIAITKGLQVTAEGDLRILPDVLESEVPAGVRGHVRLAAVGGPCIAGELAGRRHSCVIFGSRDPATLDALGAAFRTSYYHVWTTTDLVGLEYCAALKNAYALGVGLAAGVLERQGGVDAAGAHMHNLAAAVFAQSCTEIERMLRILGGSPQFAVGLPGPGDLYVTCQGGRTGRLGKLLGLGHTYQEARRIMAGETLESAEIIRVMGQALPRLVARGLLGPEELPLLRTLVDVIVHGRPVALPVDGFFQGLSLAAGH